MSISETATRAKLIDPLLTAAGWNLKDRTQVDFEIPVDGYDKEPWNGITDYCLFHPSGEVLAIVEAKKTSRDAREGQEQLRIYLDKVAAREGQTVVPFGFMTNGQDIFYWDSGTENPRLVAGFFTRDDLKRLLFIRQNGMPLQSASIDTSIVERSYQHEAIRRVTEAFANKKRRALLVMATGTGKTRTIMALIDLFLRTHQAQNVLFLADRDALVEQALTDGFKAHLPHEPRDRIYTHRIDPTKRLFVATEQTMNLCFDEFSPGFFDLIIFDEAHRSIFQRFTQVIDYFDARMIGLTATPANFIDRDTFRIFDCANQTPTYLYTFKEAVNEGHLVDFSVYKAQTGFQRKGIKGVDLTEEDRNALIDQGIDPDALDYEGTDIEIDVSNKDTLRKQWEEIMEVCLKDQSGQLPGKTILFAMTKKHAGRVRDVFEEMYPQHVGLIQVITSSTERVRDGSYGAGLITKFKQNDLPRIAVSVDMLDTGIDVPEVVNLVFLKPVHSAIKLWQMIGRGTRNNATCKYHYRLPNGEKTRAVLLPLLYILKHKSFRIKHARVAELADAPDLGSGGEILRGSSPLPGTKIIPQSNIELTGIWDMEFDTGDPAANYDNGILSDLEVLAIKRFKNGFGIGFVESWIQQITDDGGSVPAGLHGFRGRAFGIGPIITYSTKLGKSHLDFNARWIHDFDVSNRVEGDGFNFTASLKF